MSAWASLKKQFSVYLYGTSGVSCPIDSIIENAGNKPHYHPLV